MKIKMNTCYAGPDGVYGIGSIRDVPEQLAVQLVSDGFAKYCGSVIPEATAATVATLDDMMYPELVAACKEAGLATNGKKKALRARLKELEEQKALEEADKEADDQPPGDENTTLTTPENTAERT